MFTDTSPYDVQCTLCKESLSCYIIQMALASEQADISNVKECDDAECSAGKINDIPPVIIGCPECLDHVFYAIVFCFCWTDKKYTTSFDVYVIGLALRDE